MRQGNGYHGYSMSNNAVDAYESGEMPISKWTKSSIVDSIDDEQLQDKAKSIPLWILKDMLVRSSWHHTSKHFNRTNFYVFDIKQLIEITQNDIQRLKMDRKAKLDSTKCDRAAAKLKKIEKAKLRANEKALKDRCEKVLSQSGYKRLSTLFNKVESGEFDLDKCEKTILDQKITNYQNQIKGLEKALRKATGEKAERIKKNIENNKYYLSQLLS